MSPFLPRPSMPPLLLLLLPLLAPPAAAMARGAAPLRPGFYSETCPEAERIVHRVMRRAMSREPRSGASVMRLQFHDCFVNVGLSISSPLMSVFPVPLGLCS